MTQIFFHTRNAKKFTTFFRANSINAQERNVKQNIRRKVDSSYFFPSFMTLRPCAIFNIKKLGEKKVISFGPPSVSFAMNRIDVVIREHLTFLVLIYT